MSSKLVWRQWGQTSCMITHEELQGAEPSMCTRLCPHLRSGAAGAADSAADSQISQISQAAWSCGTAAPNVCQNECFARLSRPS